MTKIRSISISGFRGVRKSLSLKPNANSCLVYGDNGTGKTTMADAIEWLYFDKVKHLSSEEVGKKGEGIRNIHLDDAADAKVNVEFSDSKLNCTKVLEMNGDKLQSSTSNKSAEFVEYLQSSEQENLILRYSDLVSFVLSTKGEKLRTLSEIIGFGDITKARDVLQKVYRQLSRDIKASNFDNQINNYQSQIIEQLGENITSDKQFLTVIGKLISELGIEASLKTLGDIEGVLEKVKKPDDSGEQKRETFLANLSDRLVNVPVSFDQLEEIYSVYKGRFDGIVQDIGKLKNLELGRLLTAGNDVLTKNVHEEESCPLCLVEQSTDDLKSALELRIKDLEAVRLENKELNDTKSEYQNALEAARGALTTATRDPQCSESENEKHKKLLEEILAGIAKFDGPLKSSIVDGEELEVVAPLKHDRALLESLDELCKKDVKRLRAAKKNDPKWEAHSKISIATNAYQQIRKLAVAQQKIELQRDVMEDVFRKFLEVQKQAMQSFLLTYSTRIDQIYQFLNPGERVENIRLVPIEKGDDLVGLTIEYDFLHAKTVSPPQKYLSESHLNCLGIAIFLASVEAFNKKNKFIFLDDVISSFDADHRKRFADLIVEEFYAYQVFLFTHEGAWFDIVKNRVKSKGWVVLTVKHNDSKGTHFGVEKKSLREEIESKISSGGELGLGNLARIYLENLLKNVAQQLEVKVAYRPNDSNEERMCGELLSELKSKVNKAKCVELKADKTIDRLVASTFIGNKDSHDYFAELSAGDVASFWADIVDFEKLVRCSQDKCEELVSLKNYDSVEKQVRCKCGSRSYSWDK